MKLKILNSVLITGLCLTNNAFASSSMSIYNKGSGSMEITYQVCNLHEDCSTWKKTMIGEFAQVWGEKDQVFRIKKVIEYNEGQVIAESDSNVKVLCSGVFERNYSIIINDYGGNTIVCRASP